MPSNPLTANYLHTDPNDTAAAPSISMGNCDGQRSGTGIYGDASGVHICVAGVDKALINSSGITGTISGTASLATSLAGGLGGQIPYQSAVNTTAMLANGTAGQVLASQGTTVAPHYITLPSILSFTSNAGAGGAATEVMTVTGILSTDTILSVSQSVPGLNNLPLLGFNTQANNALTAVWSADPGAGSVILVAVKR